MKTSISAGIALTAFVGMAADQTLNSVCDLGTFTPTTTQWLYFNSNTTNEAFTLSRDADFGTLDFNANSGSVFFDFSDGNHTIKVKSFRAANRKAPWVILKGGTWNLGTGSAHDFRCYYNTEVGGRTILLDSCTVTNVDWMHGFQGTNNTLILQNGSCMYANNYRLTYPGAVATTHYTNNTIIVKDGSSILWGKSDFQFDYGGSTEEKTHSAMYVSGGSVLKTAGAGASFVLGYSSSGNAVHIDGGSRLEVPNGVTIGKAANAKHNVMTVSGNSAVTNINDLIIGGVDGANHNRMEFVDSEYYGGEYNGIYVGNNGSFNELVVSNSVIARCYFCCAGFNQTASNNTVRFIGGQTSIGGSQYITKLFGRGPNNTYMLDGCSIGSESVSCYFAYESASVKDVAAAGNTFKIVNGAVFSENSMIMNTNCHNNLIYVGALSSIRTKVDFAIHGRNNHVVVSNGTLYVSQSGSSLTFGKSASDVDETGNMLVLQGTSPKVARIDPNNNYPAQFYNGSVLKFEVPVDGYSDVVFDRTQVNMRGTAQLKFSGIEECQKAIGQTRRFQLTSASFKVYDASGNDISNTYLAQLNETMPDHSRVYRDASNYLWLEIAPIHGLSIIIR